MRSPFVLMAAVVAVIVSVTGCGDDDTMTARGASPVQEAASQDFCAAARHISDLEAEYDEKVGAALAPAIEATASGDDAANREVVAKLKALVEALPEIDAAYHALHAAAPANLTDEIESLQTFTREFVAAIQTVRTVEDLASTIEKMDGVQEADLAAIELDRYTRQECGFSINNE